MARTEARRRRRCRAGGVPKGNRGDGLLALAYAHDGDVAIVEDAAEDGLVDIDTLDLVEAHLEGLARDETGLVDDAQIGDVGLRGPAVEPGSNSIVKRHQRCDS